MSKVLIPLATGFEEIEAVNIIDVLRRAEIEVIVASLDDELLVLGANNITIKCDQSLKNITADELDMIVLPGGWGGTNLLAEDKKVQQLLKDMDLSGKNIGAICAAPFALDKAGVLKDAFTCYPSVEQQIQNQGYKGVRDMVVSDQNIMTSRGPATAICFGLEIVKKLKGEQSYNSLKEGLLATYC